MQYLECYIKANIILLYLQNSFIMYFRLFILLAVVSFFCSCKYRTPQETVPIFNCSWNDVIEKRLPKDIAYAQLEVFEVKKSLLNILDTIINAVKFCEKYNTAGIEFAFWTYRTDNKIIVCIENVNINCFDLSNCDGFFSYKGYPFYYDGIFFSEFFEKKEQVVNRRYVKKMKPKIKRIEYNIETVNDERGSYWYYVYENGELKIMEFDDCGNRWIDENIL